MREQDPVAWLRAQIEARRDLALRITAPRPHLRDSGARLSGEWQTGCTCKAECRDYPSCDEVTGDGIHIYSEGGHDADQALLIAANDPQDTIARCEAELAILDLHQSVTSNGGWLDGPEWQECETCGPNNDGSGVYAVPGRGESFWPCETVRLLASGYRHSPGYEEAGWTKP